MEIKIHILQVYDLKVFSLSQLHLSTLTLSSLILHVQLIWHRLKPSSKILIEKQDLNAFPS